MIGKSFCQNLQGNGLSCPRRTSDQPMSVGEFEFQPFSLGALADKNRGLFTHV